MDVQEKGASFVDICHAFPHHARNYRMLVYRIEHFSTFVPQHPYAMASGANDPIESIYMPHQRPSSHEIQTEVLTMLGDDDFVVLTPLADQHWPVRIHETLMMDAFDMYGALPDVTTGNYCFPDNEPTRDEIKDMIKSMPFSHINGFGLREFAARFPNRWHDIRQFHHSLADLVYFDEDEQQFFPLCENKDTGAMLSPGASSINRVRTRILNSVAPNGTLVWDRNVRQYVPRVADTPNPSELRESGGRLLDFGSPTGTPGSLPARNALSVITGWGYAPVIFSASSRPAAPTAPPVEPSPAPSVDGGADLNPPAPAVAAGKKDGGNRPRTEDPEEPPKRSKKPNKTHKIRCSRRTVKGTMCKKQKDREDDEDDWDCGVHE